MQPLEIVKLTPRSNCQACGFPSCLAFAAAVAKTGFAPGRCPFLDPNALAPLLGAPQAEDLDHLAEKKELLFIAHLKSKISQLDFATLAPRLGARWFATHPDTLSFSYLGQEAAIDKAGILLAGQPPRDHRDQILLYNYLAMGGGTPPGGEWLGLESLPNTISKVKTLATYGEERLAHLFHEQGEERAAAIGRQLGARFISEPNAALEMIVPVLPLVPHYLLYWPEEAADGFPAKVKILFDRRVLDFLDVESLVFAAERLADRFCELARALPGSNS